MLEVFQGLGKQVLLTATLKKEEYKTEKYISDDRYNAIDYSGFVSSGILQSSYKDKFVEILDSFGVISS